MMTILNCYCLNKIYYMPGSVLDAVTFKTQSISTFTCSQWDFA